jgi:hypothetical protein
VWLANGFGVYFAVDCHQQSVSLVVVVHLVLVLLFLMSGRGYKSDHPDKAQSTDSILSTPDVLHWYQAGLVHHEAISFF